MKEISINDIENIHIGQVEDEAGGTGCSVVICEKGMRAGLDIRGGGPASRESQLLNPLMAAQSIHAILLGGGSAFGLEAATGVMNYLEEHDIGLDVGVTKVPLVAQADLFDLAVGDKTARPDVKMGYEAAKMAMEHPNYQDGNYGAGCGATIGKIGGPKTCMKSGIGSYAIEVGPLKIGAIVAVNALGDIYDYKNGKMIAGLLSEDHKYLRSSVEAMASSIETVDNRFVSNTTLAILITNAHFEKSQLCKLAGMAHDGYARAIKPVHTSYDGDSIYAVSVGEVQADQEVVGTLGADVISEAIKRAVYGAKSAYGLPALCDLQLDD